MSLYAFEFLRKISIHKTRQLHSTLSIVVDSRKYVGRDEYFFFFFFQLYTPLTKENGKLDGTQILVRQLLIARVRKYAACQRERTRIFLKSS